MWRRIYAHVSGRFLSYCPVTAAVTNQLFLAVIVAHIAFPHRLLTLWSLLYEILLKYCLLFSCGRGLAFGTLHHCFIDWSLEATSSRLLLLPHQEDPSCIGDTILEFRVLSCEEGVGIEGGNAKLYRSTTGHLYVLHLQVQSGHQPSGPQHLHLLWSCFTIWKIVAFFTFLVPATLLLWYIVLRGTTVIHLLLT